MADLLTRPNHSIIQQSWDCRERMTAGPLNGDGFGIGWYTAFDPTACIFTCINPAWNNLNLRRIAEKIQSPLIFAHVRAASPGLQINEANCHPFQYGQFMFMHNGQVSGFKKIKRQLIQYLHEDLFGSLQGTTDSEHSFMLFLHLLLFAKKDEQKDSRSSSKKKQQKKGCRDSSLSIMPGDHIEESNNNHCLSSSPKNDSNTTTATTKKIKSIKKQSKEWTPDELKDAMEQTIALLTQWKREKGVKEPSFLNFSITDGHTVIVTRFIDDPDAEPASLYYASGTEYKASQKGEYHMVQARRQECYIIASEPLSAVGEDRKDWIPVPKNHMVVITPQSNLLLYPIQIPM